MLIHHKTSQLSLNKIKREFTKIHDVIDTISKHWDDKSNLVLVVLLQNASFITSDNVYGHTLSRDIERTNTALASIYKMCEYNSYHLTQWIVEEIEQIIQFAED